MKIKHLPIKPIFCFSFLILLSSFSYGQSWAWGVGGYGSLKSNDYGSPVATDKNGNAYITGQYATSVTFGNITLTSNNIENAYLTKYDSHGNAIWAVQPIDSIFNSASFGISVATDQLGNVFITGTFIGIITFGNFTLTSNGINTYSAFLVKYDPNGNVLWAKQSSTVSFYYQYEGMSYSVATDKNNNVFITGIFSDTVIFDADTLASHGQQSVFLVKYDPSGNVVWAKAPAMPSLVCSASASSVSTDNSGNVYITGSFSTAIFFGATHLISINTPSAFIAKYSNSGNILWAKQSDNANIIASMGYANSATTDWGKNVYITGYFQDSIKFGSNTLYSPFVYNSPYRSAFLTKYDSNGNVLWAKQSSFGLEGSSLATDGLNHIYMTGISDLNDTTYYMGGYTFHALAWAYGNAFILKFNTNGTAVCGSMLENVGQYYYEKIGVAADSTGTSGTFIYMAGTFGNDTLLCGPDTLSSSNGSANIFLGRWLDCSVTAGVNEIKGESADVKVYPNPGTGIFNLSCHSESSEESNPTLEIYNMLGEQVLTETLHSAQGDNNINLSNQPNGVYLYRVLTQSGSLVGQGKLIVQR